MKRAMIRFSKYSVTGFITFLFDLFLLFIFIDFFLWHYLISTPIAFIVATTINYFLVRKYVFPNSDRSLHLGYIYFSGAAILGLVTVTFGMFVFVEYFNFHYFISRTVVAGLVVVFNYIINLHFNFKVAGE